MTSQSTLQELANCRTRLTQGLETQEAIRLWRSVGTYRNFRNRVNLQSRAERTKYERASHILDTLLRGRCRVQSPLTLYRGIHVSEEIYAHYQAQHTVQFDSFIATTLAFQGALNYANGYHNHYDPAGILFKFFIPVSFPLLPISTVMNDEEEDRYDLDEVRKRPYMISHSEEIEVLLPRSTRWKVQNIYPIEDGHLHYIEKGVVMELTPNL